MFEKPQTDANQSKEYSIVTLRRLFVLEREHSFEEIATVLALDDELKSILLPDHGPLLEPELLVAIQEHIDAAKREFGDPKIDPAVDDRIAAILAKEDPLFEELEKQFLLAYNSVRESGRYFKDLEKDDLAEFFRFPTWTYELFASLSIGRRRTLAKLDPEAGHTSLIVDEFLRRIRFMEAANKLPEGHHQHLRKISTPRELIVWAVRGAHFEVHSPLVQWAQIPAYGELEEEVERMKQRIVVLETEQDRHNAGAKSKEFASLQRLCMVLACCLTKPRYDPFVSPRGFVANLRQVAGKYIEKVPDDATISKHLRQSFEALNEAEKKQWQSAITS